MLEHLIKQKGKNNERQHITRNKANHGDKKNLKKQTKNNLFKAPKPKDQVGAIYPLDPYIVPRPLYDRAKGGSLAGGKRNGSRAAMKKELQRNE